MLSVLPYGDRSRADRTGSSAASTAADQFKAYHSQQGGASGALSPSPYYNPFSSPSFLSAFPQQPHHTGDKSPDTAMDLRPSHPPSAQHSAMYGDPSRGHMYGGDPGLIDMSSHISHRIPSIKQESHLSHHHLNQGAYPSVNTNPAHSHGYTNLMASMNSMMGSKHYDPGMMPTNGLGGGMLRNTDMGSPPQASVPNHSHTANSPPQSTSQAAANLHSVGLPGTQRGMGLSGTEHGMGLSGTEHGMRLSGTEHGMGLSGSEQGSSGPSSPVDHLTINVIPQNATITPPNSMGVKRSSHHMTSPTMPLKKRPLTTVPEELKDNSYWDKRKKNNESAKRSRESRRMKEEHIAVRVVYLDQENLQLRTEVSLLKQEIDKLRVMLYNS